MKKEKDDFIKKVIIAMAIFLAIFVTAVLIIFCLNGGSEPSVLITCVFAACIGEYSVCGLIKSVKEKQETIRFKTSVQETEDEIEIEELCMTEDFDK